MLKFLEDPAYRIISRTSIKSQCLFAASQGLTFCIIALVFYIGALWIIDGKYSTASFYTVLNSIVGRSSDERAP